MSMDKRLDELFEVIGPEIKETTEIGYEKLMSLLKTKLTLTEIALTYWNSLLSSEKIQELLLLIMSSVLIAMMAIAAITSSGVFLLCVIIAMM